MLCCQKKNLVKFEEYVKSKDLWGWHNSLFTWEFFRYHKKFFFANSLS